jgi:hypothetical protein
MSKRKKAEKFPGVSNTIKEGEKTEQLRKMSQKPLASRVQHRGEEGDEKNEDQGG